MKVLLVGSGGREHALGWKLSQSPRLRELWSLPGNPGLASLGPLVEGVAPNDSGAVAAVAAAQRFDLVVVGPEAPLAAGLVDTLEARGIPAFGPTRAASRLESSKAFGKQVMGTAGVPTATWRAFAQSEPAIAHIRERGGPYVVKANGLAAGKGVLVTESREEAGDWVRRCFGGAFGPAGATVVIEEYLAGPEASVFAVCAGEQAIALEPVRDYKRLGTGDTGPNTGGMGSYSPVELPTGVTDQVMERMIRPVLSVMCAVGYPYTGFLYAGLVLTAVGPKVLEFNCRLGDPETQVLMPRLETDLIDIIEAALSGGLADFKVEWSNDAAVDVVLAADGYPESPRTGDRIRGLEGIDALVFHAGTARRDGQLVTAGGRVLNMVGQGRSLVEARARAYDAAVAVEWPGVHFRSDIGGGNMI